MTMDYFTCEEESVYELKQLLGYMNMMSPNDAYLLLK